MFTYIKGPRKVVIPVVISSVGMKVYKCEDGEPIEVDALSYRVSSGRGGELRVAPSELRPDTILDRIAVALDEAG